MQPCCELNCVMAMNIARLKRFFRALARERAEEVGASASPKPIPSVACGQHARGKARRNPIRINFYALLLAESGGKSGSEDCSAWGGTALCADRAVSSKEQSTL
jgi:hypothetical protein